MTSEILINEHITALIVTNITKALSFIDEGINLQYAGLQFYETSRASSTRYFNNGDTKRVQSLSH